MLDWYDYRVIYNEATQTYREALNIKSRLPTGMRLIVEKPVVYLDELHEMEIIEFIEWSVADVLNKYAVPSCMVHENL